MRRTAILMLVLAAALGGGAVFLARGWVQEQLRTAAVIPQQPQVNLTTVVVAKRPLRFGDRVTREVLSETKWPGGAIPAGSFKTIASIMGDGKRRVALRDIQVNEPVLKDRISGFGGRATLSTVIDKGMRAVTIRVNDVNGVAGFVLPGDRVDILLTRDWKTGKKNRTDNTITNVLMQNIKVLGVDQLSNSEKDKPKVARSVTMEVTIDQSQKLALASQVGSLSLSLRNMTNTDPTTHRMVRVRDLVDDKLVRKKPEVAKRKKRRKGKRSSRKKFNPYANVKVVRGTKASVKEVLSEKAPERGTVRSYPAPTTLPDATSPPPPAFGGVADAPTIEPRKATSGPIRLTPDSAVSADRKAGAATENSTQMPLAKADEAKKAVPGTAQ